MKLTQPPFLQPGDVIGLSATARSATPEIIENARREIQAAGFQCYHTPEILLRHGQVAGTIDERVAAFDHLIHHPEVKAIWNVRGGYGSAEIVDRVDWAALQKHPKWLIGFSDFTTFLTHGVQMGLQTLHAAMPVSFPNTDPEALAATFGVLKGEKDALRCVLPEEAHGRVIAGNLSVVFSIYGTPSLPTLEGCVLILEDLDEYHYHLDRMLTSLSRQGAFKGLRAVVLAEFSDIHDHDTPWGPDVRQTLRAPFEAAGVPIFEQAIIGHTRENWPIILRDV